MIHYYKKNLFVFILISQCTFSQQMPLDFSDSSDNFTAFSGSGFSINTDPNDSANDVGQFFNDGTDAWQGFTLDLISSVDLDFQNIISLSFYGFDPNVHNIVFKLENGTNADVEVTQNVPSGGGWTDNITFDFSNAVLSSDGSTPVDATGTYNRITIFIDGGLLSTGTYLIDNIEDGSEGTDPNELDVIYDVLVWSDEFDIAGSVNESNWHHQTQVIIPGVGWANGEIQHYTDSEDNSFVDDTGFLNIKAIKEDPPYTDQGLTKDYTSARLNSKFAFTNGRVDVRAKIPIDQGTWPAIWMLGKNINEDGGFWDASFGTVSWPECGEIDIMEHGIFPAEDINYINSAIHSLCCNGGNPNQGGIMASDLANDFHVYSVHWSPDQITFLLDDVGFYTYNPAIKNLSTWPFFEDQYIILNVAIGGLAGQIVSDFEEASMLVDYVRVYQNSTMSVAENKLEVFSVYPNPAHTMINISKNIVVDKVELYNIYGQHVLTQVKNANHVSVEQLNTGVYLMTVYFDGKKSVKKVIIN